MGQVHYDMAMKLPDGTKTECLVLHPIIGDRGMFGERADAKLWLTNDARRIPVQIKTTPSTMAPPVTLRITKIQM